MKVIIKYNLIYNDMHCKKMIYCIDGNIGAGKSTLLKSLSDKYQTFLEPIDEWWMLENFYKDKENYTFPLQYQILLSQYKQSLSLKNASGKIFIERCPYISKNVFVKNLSITNNWKNHHQRCFDELYEKIKIDINILFFLNLSPEKCLERIKIRNRFEEKNINISYIKNIDKEYKNSLLYSPYKTIIINVENKSVEKIKQEIESYIN